MTEEQIMRKKEHQRFVQKVVALLLSLGAKETDNGLYRFTLDTKVGILHLTPEENQKIGIGTLFTRFDDPATARQIVDCNQYSGKWNFHYFDGWDAETAIADLKFWLGKMISSTTTEKG
jgi:hypothetical protein